MILGIHSIIPNVLITLVICFVPDIIAILNLALSLIEIGAMISIVLSS